MKKSILSLVTLFSLFSITGASASGSSGGGGGGVASGGVGGSFKKEKKTIRQETFQLGQSIFTNKATLSESTSSLSIQRSQERTLTTVKNQLAKRSSSAAAKIDIEQLAGRLTSNQLKALRYYLDVRYLSPNDYKQSRKGRSNK